MKCCYKCSFNLCVSKLNFLKYFSDRCARSPREFWNHQTAAERRLCRRSCWLRNGSRTRTCGWSCSVCTEGAALRKMRNNAFFSGDCSRRKIGRSIIFELVQHFDEGTFSCRCGASPAFCFSYCATRRERTRLVLVCERLWRLNRADLLMERRH